VAATASIPGRDPDKLSGSPFTASGRTALGICVQDTTGTLTDPNDVLSLVAESVADLQSDPIWAQIPIADQSPAVAVSCPLLSMLLASSTRDNRGQLHADVPPSQIVTRFWYKPT
jgi:hypothetical protein